ncbi:type IX secretion system outer membrane channel protein PorV, partial [Capnocytophaga bilenii]
FSQYWNSSKYVFSLPKSGIGMSYTPYLNKLSRDIFLANLSYYGKGNRSAWGSSFRYFSIGEIQQTQLLGSDIYRLGNFLPSEWLLDLSYNLKLSQYYSMGITVRYLHSNLRLPTEEKSTAQGIAFDISGYYTSEKHLIDNYLGNYLFGFQISNIGSKIKYEDLGQSFFLPTNFKISGSYTLSIDNENDISLFLELNKLLVPSDTQKHKKTDFLEGIFTSFTDAPNGFSEEIREISWALGFEYAYLQHWCLRTGYSYQHKNKGDKKYFTIGTGFNMQHWQLDFSYLFSTAPTVNPLSNSLRVSLQYTF